MNDRKIIYLDDAIDAIVGRTNCGTEDELQAYAARHSLENLWTGGIVDAIDAIKRLPSARPEREKGKWIEIAPEEGHDIYKVKCDQCGWYDFFETHYCGNCGADMREAERRKDG